MFGLNYCNVDFKFDIWILKKKMFLGFYCLIWIMVCWIWIEYLGVIVILWVNVNVREKSFFEWVKKIFLYISIDKSVINVIFFKLNLEKISGLCYRYIFFFNKF